MHTSRTLAVSVFLSSNNTVLWKREKERKKRKTKRGHLAFGLKWIVQLLFLSQRGIPAGPQCFSLCLTESQRTLGSCDLMALDLIKWMVFQGPQGSSWWYWLPSWSTQEYLLGMNKMVASGSSTFGKFPTVTLAPSDKHSGNKKGSRMTLFMVSGTPRDLGSALWELCGE